MHDATFIFRWPCISPRHTDFSHFHLHRFSHSHHRQTVAEIFKKAGIFRMFWTRLRTSMFGRLLAGWKGNRKRNPIHPTGKNPSFEHSSKLNMAKNTNSKNLTLPNILIDCIWLLIWQSLSITHQMSPARGWKWKWSNAVEKKWNGPILMHIYDKQCEIMHTFKFSNFTTACQQLLAKKHCQRHNGPRVLFL